MSTAVNISFIKYNSALGAKLGRGASLFLGALQFLLNSKDHGIEREGRKWIYNTAEQWAQALGYSSRQIERIIVKLQKEGLIAIRKLNKFKANHTNYYSINEDHLNILLQDVERKGLEDNSSPLKGCGSLTSFDKMSETVRHQDGTISKKPNKEIIENKSDTNNSIFVSESASFLPLEEEKSLSKDQISSSPTKITIAQDMVKIWNETFEHAAVPLTKHLAPLCVAAFKQKFDADVGQWKHYCQTIASSPYLTGKGFKLSLYWSLKYVTIDRIRNGEFGVKEVPFCSYTKADALTHIRHIQEPARCKEIRLKLLKLYGEKAYKDWFESLRFDLKETRVCFQAKNKFIKDYIENKFGNFISLMN